MGPVGETRELSPVRGEVSCGRGRQHMGSSWSSVVSAVGRDLTVRDLMELPSLYDATASATSSGQEEGLRPPMGRKSKKKHKGAEESSESTGAKVDPQSSPAPQDGAGVKRKMKRKQYEKEMRVLHGELVAMQEWVKATGAKVCIVFEGRDTAGKGGTIKRITETGEPEGIPGRRPARSDRAREIPDVRPAVRAALPGRGRGRDLRPQLVQPGRGRAGDGLLHEGTEREVPRAWRPRSRRRWSTPASS